MINDSALGKRVRRRTSVVWREVLLATTCLVAASPFTASMAGGISGFTPVAGGSTLSTPNATTTVITQTADKAINQFGSLSVPGGSSLIFRMPGAGAISLNRVTGGSASQINGALQANGNVWIVNPNGVFFGRGAQVDVGGLLATTADIRDQDFLAGKYNFGNATGNPIVNQGRISAAAGGSVILAGMQVNNQGLIEAQAGTVVLAGGKSFAIDLNGDKLLRFQVTAAVDQTPVDGNGSPVGALVTNSV